MNIETLADIIQQNYEHETILQIPANNLLQSEDISQLIDDFLMPQLEITNVQKQSQTLTQLIYTGQMNLLNQQRSTVTAIFYLTDSVTDGTPQLTLAVSLPAGWTFGTTFPAFKGQIVDSLTFTKPLFVLESFTTDDSNSYPGIARGFNFSGTLQVTDSPVLYPINWLLASNLLLTGVLTNVADPTNMAPTMTLTTPLDSSSLQIGAVTLFTQTQVASKYLYSSSEEPEWTPSQHANPTLDTSVSLLGSLQLGNTPDESLTLSMTLSPDPVLLFFAITSGSNLKGLSDLTEYTGGWSLSNMIPAQFPLSQYFSLNRFALTISPAFGEILNLSMDIALHNASQNGESPTWTIIPNVVSLVQIGLSFFIIDPIAPQLRNIYPSISATLYIANTFPLVVSISLPDVTMQACLPPGETIPVDAVLQQFIGSSVKLPETPMTISEFSLIVNPNYKTFALGAVISEDWPLVTFSASANLVLKSIILSINLTETGLTGQFTGTLQFAKVNFMVSAQKNDASSSAWVFIGKITRPFSVPEVIEALTGWTPPDFLASMEMTTLGASYNTGDGTFTLDAAMQWPFQIGNYNFELDLAFRVASQRFVLEGQVYYKYKGLIAGTFEFLGLRPTFTYAFDQQNHATTYTLQLDPFTVQYVVTPTERLIISFGNTTVGEILAWVIKLADPGASAQLGTPWDALNSISLSNLSITLDFTKNSLKVDYPVSVDLGFIKIDNFSLVYTRNNGQGQVQLQLGGKFLGQTYDKNTNPLSWDALNGQPPAVPGAGTKLLDLKYVGLGQHIELADSSQLDTMAKLIAAMQNTLVPLNDTKQNPLQQVGGLQFNSGSNWLIGADFVILNTFSFSLLFNDPQMYGLLIKVSGPEAAVFQGLSFEILYRKISDKLGLFHTELKLPDAMRHLEFGEVSLTLPIIDVDIYTDGSFRLNFGFPVSLQDFSRSFCLQVFPFVGYGGFYFALLSAAASTGVPVVLNGSFNPVVNFGFALAIGVGKTLTLGPLSAGISVDILGMLEGVLGWFNPTDTSMQKALYYRIQGSVGIVGKIYGTVDFAVVKANLTLVVYASVTLAIECYKPIIISMSAGVSVQVNVKILFITVHFSFKATINLTFTIGAASTPPWIAGPNVQLPHQLRAQMNPYSSGPTHMALADSAAWCGLRYRLPTTFNMVGRAINDPNDDPIVIYAAPAFSQALPSDLTIPDFHASTAQTGAEDKPVVTAAMLLFVENAISPLAVTAQEARIPTARAADAPFNLLMVKLLRWTIEALENKTDQVSALDLASIHAKLDYPAITDSVFSYPNLTKFFVEANVIFQLQPRPITSQETLSGTFFPIFPELTMSDGIIGPVSFWNIHSVTPAYLWNLDIYFQQLLVEYENSVERNPQEVSSDVHKTILAGEDAPTSIAAFVFCSYFELLTKSVVQSAQDYLQAYTYIVDPAQAPDLSIQDIADSFLQDTAEYLVRQGDTFASIAALVGLSEQCIRVQASTQQVDISQPGSQLSVPVKVTAESIVRANQAQAGILASGGGTLSFSLDLAGVVYQVKDGDTVSQIASAFQVDCLDLLAENAAVEALLVVGTSIDFGTLNYMGRAGDSRDSVARYFRVDIEQVEQQGSQYTISGVKHVVGNGFLIPYTIKGGDTLASIIAYYFTPPPLTSERLANFVAVIESWNPQIVDFTNLVPGTLLQIPYNETFQNLACYYYPDLDKAKQLPSLLPLVETLKLMPLATLAIPTITYPVSSTDTLAGIAQKFNLTLDALTNNIAETRGIFLPGAEIKVPDVPAIKIDALCSGLKQSPLLNTAAGMASRFLLQGLRLPYPQDAVDMNRHWTQQTQLSTYPLYALTGQEYQLPTPLPQDYEITLTQTRPASWLQMPPDAPESNALSISLQLDEISQIDEFGQLQFQPNVELLTRLPLYTYSLRRFALQNMKHWQAAVLPADIHLTSSEQYTGEPTVWPLPALLQAQIARADGYELLYNVAASTYTDSSSGIQVSDVQRYLWATSVDLLVQEIQAADYSAAALPTTYLMVGADDQGNQSLLNVLHYLTGPGTGEQATLFLLYQPDPSSANPGGLASDALDTTATYLLQTNLSTVGHSGNLQEHLPLAARAPMAASNSAIIGDALTFLTLLWEGSVVKSGGYYLHYVNSNGESGLPGYLFAQNKRATLTLLILLADQEHIQPFNNAVVIGDAIDASQVNIFVEPRCYVVEPGDTLEDIKKKCQIPGMTITLLAEANADISGLLRPTATMQIQGQTYPIAYGDTFASIASRFGVTVEDLATQNSSSDIFVPGAILQFAAGQLQMQASVPSGNSGFHLQRHNPNDDPNASENQKALNTLFNLFGFSIAQNTNFAASWEGLPPGPSRNSQEGSDGVRAASSVLQEDTSTWDYKQVVSIFQSADPQFNEATDSPALPTKANSPYAGISSAPGTPAATVLFDLNFQDPYGNRTVPNVPFSLPAVPVGYTDDLISCSQWPGVSSSFNFPNGTPTLSVESTFMLTKYLPDSSNPYVNAHSNACTDYEHALSIYYQLQQRDLMQFTLQTSVGTVEMGQQARQLLHLAMRGLVSEIYQFLRIAKDLTPSSPFIAAGQTLKDVATNYAVQVSDLITANKDVLLIGRWFAPQTSLNIPTYYIFKAGDTPGYITSEITLAQIAANGDLALKAGTIINLQLNDPQTVIVDGKEHSTLLSIAQTHFTTVANLAQTSERIALAMPMTLQLEGYSVVITSNVNTLLLAAEAFNQQNTNLQASSAYVGVANQNVPDIFPAQTILEYTQYVIQEGDNLNTIAQAFGISVLTLLENNLGTPDLFGAGTALYLGDAANLHHILTENDSFAQVAQTFTISLTELARRNETATLLAVNQAPETSSLVIPFLLEFPHDTPYYTSYRADSTEMLASLVALFPSWSLQGFVDLNNDLMGIFATSPLPIGDQYTPQLTDTLNTLADHFGMTPLEFVQNIAALPDILRQDALILCPSLLAGDGSTAECIARRYHFTSAEQVAQANAALHDLLLADQNVSYTDPATSQMVSYITRANDTFVTIMANLKRLLGHTDITLGSMLAQNPQIAFRPDASLLLPPRIASFSADVTMPASYPQAIFPLTVTLTIERHQDLVDPDFSSRASISTTSTALVALPLLDGPNTPISLTLFARNFEQAFQRLKLGSGSHRENATADEVGSSSQQLWVVNFDAARGGFQYQVQPDQVRFFAIKPLSTQLWSANGITFKTYTSGQGLSGSITQDFQNANLDLWLSSLFEAVDTFLSPSYAVPAYQANPAIYQDVMNCKADLASNLRGMVDNLLLPTPSQSIENVVQDPLECARDALYQQALVSLADAYASTVLMQYPFTIQAPQSDVTLAPQLSGKPLAKGYTTGPKDDLDSLVSYYGVSRISIVTFLQDRQNFLNPTAIVAITQGGRTYQITSNDTFNTVASFFEVDLNTLAEQIFVTNDQGLFLPGVVINAGNTAREISEGDTFASIADYLGVVVTDLVWANKDVTNVFQAGTQVKLVNEQGESIAIPVEPNDTLSTITGKFYTTPTPSQAQLETVAIQLWTCDLTKGSNGKYGYVFNLGTKVYMIALMPVFSFTTGTVPLAAGQVPATFLCTIKDAAQHKMTFLNLDYVINELQYNLQPPQFGGYQQASWLSLIIPINETNAASFLSSAAFGQTQIPIPLRVYPTVATLSGQTGNPSHKNSPDLELAKKWTYAFNMDHQNAAQDSLAMGIFFNWTDSTPSTLSKRSATALYTALAQFALAYPQLKQDLNLLITNPADKNIALALSAFAQLLLDVCQAWPTGTENARQQALAAESHWYELDTVVDQATFDKYEYLILKTTDDPAIWPQLNGNGPAMIIPGTYPHPSEALYHYTQPITQPLDLLCRFVDQDIIQRQNGWSGISVTRNQHLLTLSAANQPVDTNPAFVYSTPLSLFANKIYPLLSISNLALFQKAPLTADPVTELALALGNLFSALFNLNENLPPATYTIKVTARYIYTKVAVLAQSASIREERIVIDAQDTLDCILPVVLVPQYGFKTPDDADPGNPNSFVSQLAAATDAATTQLGVATPSGARTYLFDVTVYSSLSTNVNAPLLQMTNLLYQPQ